MARLTALPAKEIIDKLKGAIDFYLWKGIAVARKWPHYPPRLPTPAELANQQLFAYAIAAWAAMEAADREIWMQLAAGTNWTARDLFVSAYLRGFKMAGDYAKELTLAEVAARIGDEVNPDPGSTNKLLTTILARLDVAASTSARETGGVLDDILAAIAAIAPFPSLGNQPFGWNAAYIEYWSTLEAAAGTNVHNFATVPADEVWILQNAHIRNDTRTQRCLIEITNGANYIEILDKTADITNRRLIYEGQFVIPPGYNVRAIWFDCLLHDDLFASVGGYKMNIA